MDRPSRVQRFPPVEDNYALHLYSRLGQSHIFFFNCVLDFCFVVCLEILVPSDSFLVGRVFSLNVSLFYIIMVLFLLCML